MSTGTKQQPSQRPGEHTRSGGSPRGNGLADYITVAERIEAFYIKYPTGAIRTKIVEHDAERGFILMRAECFRDAADALPAGVGHAYELKSEGYVQRTSYIEVGETSSVGRCLAMAGFEVKRGIASREEMEKATHQSREPENSRSAQQPATQTQASTQTPPRANGSIAKTMADLVTPKQLVALRAIASAKRFNADEQCRKLRNCVLEELSRSAASELIDQFKDMPAPGEGVAPRQEGSTTQQSAPAGNANQNGARDDIQKLTKALAVALNKLGHPDFRDKTGIKFWLRNVAKTKWSIQIDPETINTADDLSDDLYAELPGILQAEIDQFKQELSQSRKAEDDAVF